MVFEATSPDWSNIGAQVAIHGWMADSTGDGCAIWAVGQFCARSWPSTQSGGIPGQQTETMAHRFSPNWKIRCFFCEHSRLGLLACRRLPMGNALSKHESQLLRCLRAAACGGCCDGTGCQSCHGCCYGVTGCNASHSALPGHNLFVGDFGSRGCARPGPTLALCGQNPTPERKPPRA